MKTLLTVAMLLITLPLAAETVPVWDDQSTPRKMYQMGTYFCADKDGEIPDPTVMVAEVQRTAVGTIVSGNRLIWRDGDWKTEGGSITCIDPVGFQILRSLQTELRTLIPALPRR